MLFSKDKLDFCLYAQFKMNSKKKIKIEKNFFLQQKSAKKDNTYETYNINMVEMI